MELKSYQKQALRDLTRYLALMNETGNMAEAYRRFWLEKNVLVGGGVRAYQNILPGVPHLCFKVPTGGGKTYLACASLRSVFDALPPTKAQAVVWLVPSDAILEQTVKNLKNPRHPYRMKLEVDFGGRVQVYTKEELSVGQQFSPAGVVEQLSVMVLSYDSFRTSKKEGRKAYQENGYLMNFAQEMPAPEALLEDVPDTALIQAIRKLNPVVVVDESHHAGSELSVEMLRNFNPSFVLDLTATPRKESNIISFVEAAQLKRENMVKLPVIVYNRDKIEEVVADAIDLRNALEKQAVEERAQSGCYIRPIVLFQAQPKGKEDSTTFERLKDKLIGYGIPKDEIAIKTADINELRNVELLAEDCPIRYIITVNALKEGWDCPFAYVLASLANKTSQVDVEQILGRVLRQPHTRQHAHKGLNRSYVLTCSSDFNATLDGIVRGLNSAGFNARDYRVGSLAAPAPVEPMAPIQGTQLTMDEPQQEDIPVIDDARVREILEQRQSTQFPDESTPAFEMLSEAEEAGDAYDEAMAQLQTQPGGELPLEVREKMDAFVVMPEFAEEVQGLMLPQFFLKIPESVFFSDGLVPLDKAALAAGFSLKGKPYDIDFTAADDEIAQVDVADAEGSTPRALKMSGADQRYFKAYFNSLPQEKRVKQCKDIIHHQLNKLDGVDSKELQAYIDLIVGQMDKDQLAALEKSPLGFAGKIRAKIDALMEEHCREQFDLWLQTERIVCKPSFRLPIYITPVEYIGSIGKSLYQAEAGMDSLERELVMNVTALPNVRWWHRIMERHDFYINGFINHYPDIMLRAESGRIILAETKGVHLKNDDSRAKVALGAAWAKTAGSQYRYFMVFRDGEEPLEGAVTMSRFLEILKEL